MSKVAAVVQARMASNRLPGKVLMDLEGAPMLARQIRRLKQCARVDEIFIATTTDPLDDPVEELAGKERVGCFRGSESDVLGRFVGVCRLSGADVILRITADCPLMDPEVVDRVAAEILEHPDTCDYASNVLHRTFPHGLDVEAFFADVLMRVDRLARSPLEREHVTMFIYSVRPQLFLLRSVVDSEDNADLRWTVDMPQDLELIRRLYRELDLASTPLPFREIVRHVRANPHMLEINAGIQTWQPPR